MKEGKIRLDDAAVHQPRTLFKPSSWLAKIDFINHLVLFNNALITVLSEQEGGKTSFSTLLQNHLDTQIKSISMIVKPPCNREAIINDIATQLHLNNDAQTDMTSIVAQINERKAHVLLIIDDAQHLPESLIKEVMLAIRNQGNFSFFHLCLVSDYSVVAALNSLASDQFNHLIHTIELGSLSESEMRTYVLQRAMAAHLINKPLSDSQFKQFCQLTKGNMAKINSHLEAFIFKCFNQKKGSKALLLKKVSLVMMATAAIGISYFYADTSSTTTTTAEPSRGTTSQIEKIVEQASVSPRPLTSYIASWQDFSTRQLVHYALPKKQILDGMEDEEENINTVALVDKVVVIPSVKTKITSSNLGSPVTQEVLESKIPMLTEYSQLVKKTAVKLNTSGYTIQLVASHKISDVHQFRKNNNLLENTKIRQFINAKGTWYILTLGEYDSRNKAQFNAKKLPAKLAKLNPWIRPVSGLSNVG